jgi:hypothetical protein
MATENHIQVPEDATDARKEIAVGGTPQSVFDFPWPYFNVADIKVYVDGVLQTTGYTLAPTATKEGGFEGGTVTFAVALTNKTVIVEREVALSRTDDFPYPSNKLAIQALNTALDRVTALFQQFRRLFKRTIRAPIADTLDLGELPVAAQRAGLLLGFDGNGQLVVRAESGGAALILPLALAQGGTGASDAAGARAALGLGDLATLDLSDLVLESATITAGENLADRDLIYQDVFNERGNGAARWYKIDADATGPVRISPRIGIALAAITAGNTGLAQVRPGRVAGFSGLTAGLPVFASATAGALTQTPPAIPASGAQIATRLIGYAASATEIDFDPDDDTVFTARSAAVAVDGTITVQHFPDAGAAERVPGAYLVAATSEGVIAGGTASAPVFGFAAGSAGNLTDNNSGTTADSGGTGDLTAASEANRRVFVVDYGSNKSLTKIELVSGRRASGANSSNYGLYHSTDGSTWTQAGSNFVLTGTAATQTITVSATARYIALIAVAENQGTGGLLSGVRATELRGYALTGAREEPVLVGSATIDAAATDRVICRFDDGAGANADTRTTFVNRTNATRDLAVEVVL